MTEMPWNVQNCLKKTKENRGTSNRRVDREVQHDYAVNFLKKLNFTRNFLQKEATVLTNITIQGKIFFPQYM